MNPYFAYGSNLSRTQMRQRCPGHRHAARGSLRGYRWIISSRGVANVVVSPRDYVLGDVFLLTPQDETRLDYFESVHKGHYLKSKLPVETDAGILNCLVYIDPVTAEGPPRAEYIRRINQGIREATLCPNYIADFIRRFIPAEESAASLT